jgi:hypothetical protein
MKYFWFKAECLVWLVFYINCFGSATVILQVNNNSHKNSYILILNELTESLSN